MEWFSVVEPGVEALVLCAALPESPVRKIAGYRADGRLRVACYQERIPGRGWAWNMDEIFVPAEFRLVSPQLRV